MKPSFSIPLRLTQSQHVTPRRRRDFNIVVNVALADSTFASILRAVVSSFNRVHYHVHTQNLPVFESMRCCYAICVVEAARLGCPDPITLIRGAWEVFKLRRRHIDAGTFDEVLAYAKAQHEAEQSSQASQSSNPHSGPSDFLPN